jgi:pyruvate formate lyase activating enzyme
MIKAAWWQSIKNDKVVCELCPIACTLKSGQSGPCGTRINRDGEMQPLHYGELVSAGVDPIEKKPLYHFNPGGSIFSVAAPGCNLHCKFCQNWTISQGSGQVTATSTPRQVVEAALKQKSMGIAFTYSEPLVWYEFVRDTAREARAAGLKNVLVTNGFLNPEPLAEILPLIDAANIDLKAMDDEFYRKICKAGLEPVLATIRQFHQAGVHLELTNLLIPGYNDSPDQIDLVIDFVADLDPDIPLHFSAYHRAWKMDAPPTPRATMLLALERAQAKLPWVYLGNIGAEEGRDTICPDCGVTVITRSGYRAKVDLEEDGRCPGCDRSFPFVLA